MEDQIKIIAFGHRRRVGKDTAVKFALDYLKRAGYHNAQRLSFFDPIKEICHKIYRWGGLEDGIYYENLPHKKEEILPPIGKSPRDIWINTGQFLTNECPQVLCEMAFTGLKPGIYLIPDLRRPIEVEYVHKFNGRVVRIDRDSVEKFDDPCDGALANYDGWDAHISNDGTLKEFVQKIHRLLGLVL